MLNNKYEPPLFKTGDLKRHQKPPNTDSFSIISSSYFWIHATTCKNAKHRRPSLEVCLFWVTVSL